MGIKRTRLLSAGGGNVECIVLVGSVSVANKCEVRAVGCDVVWLQDELSPRFDRSLFCFFGSCGSSPSSSYLDPSDHKSILPTYSACLVSVICGISSLRLRTKFCMTLLHPSVKMWIRASCP